MITEILMQGLEKRRVQSCAHAFGYCLLEVLYRFNLSLLFDLDIFRGGIKLDCFELCRCTIVHSSSRLKNLYIFQL